MDRPDLDEFLSALNGFLDNKTSAPHDPGYLRFLEIFCRSVGSGEGHLLKFREGPGLQSIAAFGISEKFESEMNAALAVPGRELTPLDAAFRDREVFAVVEIKRGAGIPAWFLEIMNRYNFKALIAVPLVGQTKPVGILCAYYRDVCLFDKGTTERLMTVGRMVGAATENSHVAGRMETMGAHEKVADEYLRLLTSQAVGKTNIFEALVKVLVRTLAPTGVVCGPVHLGSSELVLTVAEGSGMPMAAVSQRFPLPPLLAQPLVTGQGARIKPGTSVDELGALQRLVPSKSGIFLCQPITWQKQPHAAIFAWRSEKNPFTDEEESLVSRLAGMTALALR